MVWLIQIATKLNYMKEVPTLWSCSELKNHPIPGEI